MLSSVKFRILLTGLVLAAVGGLLFPRATGFVSTSAFINAPILSVRAPFEGLVDVASKPRADALSAGETLLELVATRDSRLELARLTSQVAGLRGRLAALDTQIETLDTLSDQLSTRRDGERRIAMRHADSRIQQALAEQSGAEADLRLLTARRDRAAALSERDFVSQTTVRELEIEIDRARSELDRAKARVRALRIEAQAIGIFGLSGQGAFEVPYVSQRLDEIGLRLAALMSERATVAGELASLTPLVAETRRKVARVDRFAPVAPAASAVWRPSPGAQATLVGGDEAMQLLDCSRRYVEVTFRERHFEQIRPGSIAQVQLKGSDRVFSAPVTSMRGVGPGDVSPETRAIDSLRTDPRLTLFLDIPGVDPTDPAQAGAFCDVGRSAEVRILRPSLAPLNCFLVRLTGGRCALSEAEGAVAARDPAAPAEGTEG